MHKHKSNTYRHRCLAERHGFFISMGTVNSILFPAHLSIMFRHNRYQPNIFDIIFINGSTIIHFTHYDLIVRTKPHFISLRVIGFDAPMLNVKSTLLFQRLICCGETAGRVTDPYILWSTVLSWNTFISRLGSQEDQHPFRA